MSRPIQTQPHGLLGFLQLKNQGKNPSELPDVLAPTIELRDWMFGTNWELVQATTTVPTGVGPFFGLSVPNGEYWAVDTYDVVMTLAALATIDFEVTYSLGTLSALSLQRRISEPRLFDQATTGTVAAVGMPRRRLLFVPPGGTLGVFVRALSAVPASCLYTARITRLLI